MSDSVLAKLLHLALDILNLCSSQQSFLHL